MNSQEVQTNIVVFDLAEDAPVADLFVAKAKDLGVLVLPFGHRTIRVVTHLDVSLSQCERAAEILVGIADWQT